MVDSDLDLLSAAAVSQKLQAQKRKLKQKREPNWTLVEKETLRNICLEYMDVINNRRTDNEMCGLKNRTWMKITEAMREAGYNRNVARVREAYARMKKVDKGVVVLQLPMGRNKETNPGSGSGGDGQELPRNVQSLRGDMQRNSRGANKYYSDDSESDESNESLAAKRMLLSLRRKSSDSFYAERDNSVIPRRPLGMLQLKSNTLAEKSDKADLEQEGGQEIKKQGDKKKVESHFELENLNLKVEVGSSLDQDNDALTPHPTPTKANNSYAEPNQDLNAGTQRSSKRHRRIPASTICNNANNLSLMHVQIEEGVAQLSNDALSGVIPDSDITLRAAQLDAETQRKAEIHRYQMSAEEKRLALLDLQLEQVRLQMRFERHLYEKDLEAKQFKLELMRRYKK